MNKMNKTDRKDSRLNYMLTGVGVTMAAVAASLMILTSCSGENAAAAVTDTSTASGVSYAITETVVDASEADGTFTFSSSGINAAGVSSDCFKIEGSDLTITAAGTYVITGSSSDGSITVKKGVTGVTLILQDLDLTSSTSAPLSINKESEAAVIVSGTVTLTDAEDPADESSTDTAVAEAYDGAAVKVKSGASLTIAGSGTLNLNGDAKNGVKGAADADVTITGSVTVNVTAENNGIASEGTVTVLSGYVTITAEDDGIKSESDDETTGTVTISGGDVSIKAGGDGIQAASLIDIAGGSVTIDAADDAIHSDGDVTITDGTVTIKCGDDAIHAEKNLVLGVDGSETGPEITVTASREGLEGAYICLYSGSGSFTATDDGANAADGNEFNSTATLTITGGDWYINSYGDGLDSNGAMTITGGTTIVFGSQDNGNSALDFDGSCTQTGGTLLVIGTSGMAQTPSATAVVYSGVSVSSGTTIEIKDASGNTLVSTEGTKSANWICFSGDALTEGSSYTLYLNGKSVSTQTAAAYTGSGMGMGGMMGGGMMGGPGNGGNESSSGGDSGAARGGRSEASSSGRNEASSAGGTNA